MQVWVALEQETISGSLRPRPEKTTCSFPYRCSGKTRNSGLVPGNCDPKNRDFSAQPAPKYHTKGCSRSFADSPGARTLVFAAFEPFHSCEFRASIARTPFCAILWRSPIIDSHESIRRNRPDSRCESPGHLRSRILMVEVSFLKVSDLLAPSSNIRPALSGGMDWWRMEWPFSRVRKIFFRGRNFQENAWNSAERAIFAKFQAPKFENSEPEKMQFHTPSHSIPPLDSLLNMVFHCNLVPTLRPPSPPNKRKTKEAESPSS